MTDTALQPDLKPETQSTTAPNAGAVSPASAADASSAPTGGASQAPSGDDRPQRRRNERNPRRPRKPRERVRQEFEQQIISIRRVTRVMGGGRRFSFSVAMVIGNGKGKVGVGLGKSSDTASAIEKAVRDARKTMIDVPLTDDQSIGGGVRAKYAASEIMIVPAPGLGLRAGGAVRTVCEMAGIKNISAKILSRSKNHLNNARAAMKALQTLR